MYQVIFCDDVHDVQVQFFDDLLEAIEYWNDYADTPTCFAGELKDLETNAIIWEFDDSED